MSNRRFYGPKGEYRGHSTSSLNWGPLIALVGGLWGLDWLAKWCRGFLYSAHPQPYQIIADFYRVLAATTGDLASAFLHLDPTPYRNLNGLILLAITISVAVGMIYGLGAVASRIGIRKRRFGGYIAFVIALPAIVGISWWTVIALVRWLFARTA